MSILAEYAEIRKKLGDSTYRAIVRFLDTHDQYLLSDVYYKESVFKEFQAWRASEMPVEIQFTTKKDLAGMSFKADRAASEKEHSEAKDAMWCRGFADALKAVTKAFDAESIYRAQAKAYRLEDAKRQLKTYFGIDEDDLSASEDCIQEFSRVMGMTFEAATDPESDTCILGDLVERFSDAQDCNVAENDTWHDVIANFVRELCGGKK